MEKLSGRLEALIARGYPREDVIRLSSFTDEDLKYASTVAFNRASQGVTKVNHPVAVFVGGQPGSGKSCLSMKIKEKNKNAVEIGIDNYRMYHPNYLEIEEYIKKHWENKKISTNDTPGNDIADFTHQFAGAMTDELISKASNQDELGNSYNILLEWGMREPTGPLKTMSDLNNRGYYNKVIFVCVHKDISLEACDIRANIMNDGNHIIRKVPPVFHSLCVDTLPESIDKIYKTGISNNIIDDFKLCLRDGKIVWDNDTKLSPGSVFNLYLNNYDLTKDYKNSSLLSFKTNGIETQGLNEKINALKNLKKEVIYTVMSEEVLKSFYNQEYSNANVK